MKVPSIKDLTKNMVEVGIITAEQLKNARKKVKESGGNLGEILISEEYINEDVFTAFLGKKSDISYVDLSEYEIDSKALNLIPESFARKRNLIPIEKKNNTLVVAIPDPMDIFITDDLRAITGTNIEVVLAVKNEIKQAIDKYYGSGFLEEDALPGGADSSDDTDDLDIGGALSSVMKEIKAGNTDLEVVDTSEQEGLQDITKIKRESQGAPVVKMVNIIILNAIKKGASDIHIEPFEKSARVRYRIDGVLHTQPAPPKKIYNAVVARLKVMGSLDVAEKRKPQDGRIKVTVGNKDLDLRASFLPSTFGEKVVMRILDSSSLCLDLTDLGFEDKDMAKYSKALSAPNGIILVTGPTGSGKTTTLYSSLTTLNQPDVNINTIEDPVEYILKGIIQVQANAEIGMTFAEGLRSFLRQDPDIIMVGEIRDQETAQISINAAMTGHLVLSTLHTNDAPSAITRLDNMGIEPFHISSTVKLALAQRLARKICPKCKESYEVEIDALSSYGLSEEDFDEGENKVTLYKGSGCTKCSGSGYKGRIGLYELMEINNEIKELINQRKDANAIKEAAVRNGMSSLRHAALKKVLEGRTTIDEMLRVTARDTG
jgi:type IV pilus assembly protein PilB